MGDFSEPYADCVVIGHHEPNIDELCRSTRRSSHVSAAWHDLAANSLEIAGRRVTYTRALEQALDENGRHDVSVDSFNMPHLGACHLASALDRAGLRVKVANYFNTDRAILHSALQQGARTVAITTTFYVTDDPIKAVVRYIRSIAPNVYIIIGGPRINAVIRASRDERRIELYLSYLDADVYVADPQGEATLPRVVAALSRGEGRLEGIANLFYRERGASKVPYVRTSIVPEENDLEETTPSWASFNAVPIGRVAAIRTARSCPFTCAFCNFPAAAGAHVCMSPGAVLAQVTALAERGVERLIFIDDTFNVPLPRFKEILRRLRDARLGIRWTSFFRASNADEECFDLMAQSGCESVYLGIESGDAGILSNMRKFAKVERYRSAIGGLSAHGIDTLSSVIIGFPGETAASVDNTIALLQESGTTYVTAQLYFHDDAAPIEQERDRYGLRGTGFSWSHATMDWQEGCHHLERLLIATKKPQLVPIQGLGLWSIPYLYSNGISRTELHAFLEVARTFVLRGLSGTEPPAPSALWSTLGKKQEIGDRMMVLA